MLQVSPKTNSRQSKQARASGPSTDASVGTNQPAKQVFVIAAPAYDHRSMGIRSLHILCNELNRIGREAYLLHYRFRPGGGQDFRASDADADYCPELGYIRRLPATDNVESHRALLDEAYVIYPEVLRGNPLGARRVIRYVLNSPEANGYSMMEGAHDYIASFHPSYWKAPHFLLPMRIRDAHFHDHKSVPTLQRTLDCTYIGKGQKFGPCFKVPGTVMLERTWPADKESLALLLRQTRYLFIWDIVTQMHTDALLCGAIPVIMRWPPYTPAVFNNEFGAIPYADIRIDGASLLVNLDWASFQRKRQQYLSGYNEYANKLTTDVAAFASEVDRYFGSPYSPSALPGARQLQRTS